MSRARVQEVSSPISLFPFIGILLCTMGALLVILVAVSRSAKNTAVREVQSHKHSDAKVATEGTQKKIQEVKTYIGSLDAVRGQAESRLRDEQLRLSHVEDHIRRLHERVQAIQSSAAELKALEQEHYDDHEQAAREIDRLHKLIVDSKKSVESLRDAGSATKRSYAVVPYEGPNGTFRRPIYIECTRTDLIIQPEGIHITAADLRPPVTPGNPLATVLRAIRDHLLRMNPAAARSRDTEPYALLLVRPDGIVGYYAARKAVEAGDFDLGFELIESDWKIKFPAPDAQLAGIAAQVLEQARARQELLAAAAPRAYGSGSLGSAGEFDDDHYEVVGSGGRRGSGRAGGVPRDYIAHRDAKDGNEVGRADDTGNHPGENTSASGGSGTNSSSDGVSSGSSEVGGTGGPAPTGVASGAGSPAGSSSSGGASQPPAVRAPEKGLTPDGYHQSLENTSLVAGPQASADSNRAEAGPDPRSEKEKLMTAESRGKDWALQQKPPKSVPVRRTIHVTVSKDQLTIRPDSGLASGGKVVPMRGDTVESVDEFVKQVREHIDGWGIAGTNLYWRPVVVLSVVPDGRRRASDLERLLKNSGLELRSDEIAKSSTEGGARETR